MLLRKNIPVGYIFGKIRWEMLFIVVYTIIIAVLYRSYHVTRISIPLSVPMVLGTVISLLLAFRSNQAYDRWWEARHIWGAIVNDSRTISRQIFTFVAANSPDEREAIHNFQRGFLQRQMAWCYCLSQRLRGENPVEGLDRLLTKRELNTLSRYSNANAALLELHGADLAYALDQGWINQYQQVEMDNTISRLCDAMGKCERIKNTVFPVTYSLYIKMSTYVFIFMLPFALIEVFGTLVVPLVVLVIGAFFMLVEKMAVHLQDPFENKPTDTPMTAISHGIEKDLRQMLNDHHEPLASTRVSKKKDYFLM